jgi:hypothetical protein
VKVFAHYFGKPGLEHQTFINWELKRCFEDFGVQFTNKTDADEIWIFDLSLLGVLSMLRWPKTKRRLFIFEPNAVNPLQHRDWMRKLFQFSYVFSRDQIRESAQFIEGGGFNPNRVKVRSSDNKQLHSTLPELIVSVAAGDKQSLQSGSLYWLRRDAMEALAREGFGVKLIGPFWQEGFWFRSKQIIYSLFQSLISGTLPKPWLARPRRFVSKRQSPNIEYLGYADDEIDFYESADIVLVVENDIESLSEKLFSAVCSGRSVVYVGPQEARELPGLKCVLFSEATVRDVVTNVLKAASLSQSKSEALILDLENRSFTSFYARLVQKVLAQVS